MKINGNTLCNEYITYCSCTVPGQVYVIPSELVSIDELIVLPVLLPNTAVTLTVQLLPALREVMVWVVAVPSTVSDDDRYSSESHNS